MRAVAVVVVVAFVGACNEEQTTTFATSKERDDFVRKGLIPPTLALGSTLTWELDTNTCTITTSTMPVGTIEGGMLIVGDKRWWIVSTSPVVLKCPAAFPR